MAIPPIGLGLSRDVSHVAAGHTPPSAAGHTPPSAAGHTPPPASGDSHTPPPAPGSTPQRTWAQWMQENDKRLACGAFGGTALVAGGGGYLWGQQNPKPPHYGAV